MGLTLLTLAILAAAYFYARRNLVRMYPCGEDAGCPEYVPRRGDACEREGMGCVYCGEEVPVSENLHCRGGHWVNLLDLPDDDPFFLGLQEEAP
ncbi:MAG: hypothetical protein DRJ42_21980 [Deltaproteobacteria bacterium]|nr:MAG: hypothetical protein DRJ42_21980 [Deltaproteobacteria bacterium]